ncbi:MAG: hypothetical protein ACI89L_002795 [Phycisphaerales bacterium]|jgi:hypothetical protein
MKTHTLVPTASLSLALLGFAAPASAQPIDSTPAPAPQRRVLVIGVDGFKPDAIAAANTPAFDALVANGTYNDNAQCEDLTYSGPNWSTILHGVHRDRHGVVSNSYEPSNLANYPDLLAHVEHAHPGWTTARLDTWDSMYQNQPTGADIFLFKSYDDGGDDYVAQTAATIIAGDYEAAPDGVNVIFVYLGNVDIAGHTHGFHKDQPGYLAGIEVADAQIAVMADAVAKREAQHDEDWLIILTSDHGGNIDGGHAGNTIDRRTIPFLVSGRLAAKGRQVPEPKNVDVVPTALAYLGIEPLELADGVRGGALDGHAVGLEPTPASRGVFDTNLIINPGGEHDRGFASADLDQAIAGWVDPGPGMMTLIPYGAADDWPNAATEGPDDRGQGFFAGGTAPISEITQDIDLSALTGRVYRGRIRFTLSGWFGGFGNQDDSAELRVEFFSPDGLLVGGGQIGPVTADDRGFETKLLYREYAAYTPQRAVRARVTLRSTKRAGEASDGYADNLSLVINSR